MAARWYRNYVLLRQFIYFSSRVCSLTKLTWPIVTQLAKCSIVNQIYKLYNLEICGAFFSNKCSLPQKRLP